MQSEKRIIQLFKSFVQRALLPQLKKFNVPTFQWDRFSNLISQQSLNYGQIQAYVESFPQIQSFPTFEKSTTPIFLKKKQEHTSQQLPNSFANKTFGGERARMALIQNMNMDDNTFDKKKQDFSYSINRTSNSTNSAYTLPSLDRMFRNFTDNHNRIQAIVGSLYDGGFEGGFDGKTLH